MKNKIKFSQLWIEEEQYLREQSARLQENSIVVEIGTAQGGSAFILATSTTAQNISIHTYDISPSDDARKNLHGLDCITTHGISSADGAAKWAKQNNHKIDFLFIDGSHTLENIFSDFLLWFPHVKEGATIAIHDYDPLHRGGFAHLGVKVFVDALLNLNVLVNTEHIGRIIGGVKGQSVSYDNLVDECFNSWKKIGQKVSKFRQFDFDRCVMLGEEDTLVSILRQLFRVDSKCILNPPENQKEKVLILPQPISKSISEYMSKNDHSVLLEELTFFYLLWDQLSNNRNMAIQFAQDKSAFFKWEEILEMFDHANNIENTNDVFDIRKSDIHTLSKICARELVRVNILKNIFLSMTGGI